MKRFLKVLFTIYETETNGRPDNLKTVYPPTHINTVCEGGGEVGGGGGGGRGIMI